MVRDCILGVFIFLAALSASGQTIPFNILGIKDGLPQATITCMMQDRAGYIWAGTKDGLTRYDGYRFEVIRYVQGDSTSLSSNSITSLSQDFSGNIWVGTNFGLNMLNPATLTSRRYYHWFEDDRSLSSNKITSIITDNHGDVWIGTENGLNKLESIEGSFKSYSIRENDPFSLSGNAVNTLYADRNNNLWVGTDAGLNLLLPEGNFERYKKDYDDDNSLSDNMISSIAEDHDGNLWIGTRNGLNKFNPVLEIFSRYYADTPKKDLLGSSIINALMVDANGKIWVGTPTGLNQLYRSKSDVRNGLSGSLNFGELPNSYATCLMSDRSGLIWIGTLSAGIATLNNEAQQFFSQRFSQSKGHIPELNKSYSFFRPDDQTLLAGTGAGIMKFKKDGTQIPDRMQWKPSGRVEGIEAVVRDITAGSDGKLWAATDGEGLWELDPETFETVAKFTVDPNDPDGIPSNKVSCIQPSASGDLWVGTIGGGFSLYTAATGKFKIFRFSGDDPASLRDNNISCMYLQDEETLWLGTGNSGLYRFDVQTEMLHRFEPGNPAAGHLGSGVINDIHIDNDNNLWVATSGGGLCRYEGGDRFTSFTIDDGLASNVVLGIRCDFENNLWVSTNGGISAYSPETATFRNYNEKDMPGSNTFFAGSSFQDNESRIYFGGANGFYYFYAEGLRENTFIPPVVICRFNLLRDDVLRQDSGRDKRIDDRIELKHNHPGFTIEFAALNYKQPEKNQYAYRLIGLSDEWRYMGSRRFATFSNLAPGSYRFEVRGSNNDGFWNEEPAVLPFKVAHAFWQTAAFKVAAIFLLIAILYVAYRYRIQLEKTRRSELEGAVKQRTSEIVKERDTNVVLLREVHHRVKNNLQIIVSLLSLQSRFITDRKLVHVFDEVQNRVRSMSLIHQKMYQSKDLSTVNIAEYVNDLSENLLKTYNLSQKVQLEVNVAVNRFKSDTLTPLGLIINEIISNALKYAFTEETEGTVFVEIKSMGEGRYRMVIGDNGVGIPESTEDPSESGSFGTELIYALTEQLNGTIVRDTKRSGTVYIIDFEDLEE